MSYDYRAGQGASLGQELISDLTIGSEEEEARMFRADQLLPTLLSGSVKNEVESVDKETLPMGIKCFPK